jgi:Flp pilus assembly protein TadB
MANLITPVILASFGGVVVLVVLGFMLARQRTGRPRFESQDYYKKYQRPERFSDNNPFRQRDQNARVKREQRAILLAVSGLVILSIALAVFFDPLEGLLLLFLLPIVVRFVRARYETRRAPHDENQSY